jgi:hypothetical protein
MHPSTILALEYAMAQLVVDLHDAARIGEATDLGAATALRLIAHDLHELVQRVRRLLVSEMDSNWGGLNEGK